MRAASFERHVHSGYANHTRSIGCACSCSLTVAIDPDIRICDVAAHLLGAVHQPQRSVGVVVHLHGVGAGCRSRRLHEKPAAIGGEAQMPVSCYGDHPALSSRRKSLSRGQRPCCTAINAELHSCMPVWAIATSCGALRRHSAAAAKTCNVTAPAGKCPDKSRQ